MLDWVPILLVALLPIVGFLMVSNVRYVHAVSFLLGRGQFFTLVGLVFAVVAGFAVPAVIVHRMGPVEALQRSLAHASAHPVWHLGYAACVIGIQMVLSYIPFIGIALMYPFLMSFQLRAYTRIFGFGDVE